MKKLLIGILKFYKNIMSPFLHRLSLSGNHTCRFSPTCSEYTRLCVEKYGVLKGSFYGLRQVMNCHSFKLSV